MTKPDSQVQDGRDEATPIGVIPLLTLTCYVLAIAACLALGWLMFVLASYTGFPDGGRTSFMRCAEPFSDWAGVLPLGAAALLGLGFRVRRKWLWLITVLIGLVIAVYGFDLLLVHVICAGLENGTGG